MNQLFISIQETLKRNCYFICDMCFIRGSYVGEFQTKTSDIDLLVISNDFAAIGYMKRKELVIQSLEDLHLKMKIDPICLDIEEYEQIVRENRELIREEMVRIV